ncbi:MAG: hypothetical protein ABSF50_05840 [Burkholderiaceae bacterium]
MPDHPLQEWELIDFDAYRTNYAYVSRGKFSIEYRIRHNNAGSFGMPATRVEAMYASEVFGTSLNPLMHIDPCYID